MLRAELRDAALTAAKGQSHATVEPRHVWFAVARHFKDRPEVEPLVARAKRALEPKGQAFLVPTFTTEAEALVAGFSSEDVVISALLQAFDGDAAEEAKQASPTATAVPPGTPVTERDARPTPAAAAPQTSPRESIDTVLTELERLVGLEKVKQQLKRVFAVVQANEERKRAGLAPVSPSLHLVFTGPPGTGKTTVARLVARLYAAAGALPGKNFTEATRADLVAAYVGQTAIKTADLIKRTTPGVLFIDEAYALTPRHDSDFGAEAVATLVKAMEDHRQKLAVIVAGYDEEMAEFVGSNPGLKSRFTTYIKFPDYSPSELARIFEGFAGNAGIRLAEGVVSKAESIFATAMRQRAFGNARFARSLFEDAYARMSTRAAEDGKVEVAELMEIALEDVAFEVPDGNAQMRHIGFREAR